MAREVFTHSSDTIKVICWVLSMTSAIVTIIRFATKLAVTNLKKWSVDDFMIILALAFSIAQSVILTIAASYGFGDQTTFDSSQIIGQERFVYISDILFLLSMTFGMLATNQLILSLSPNPTYRDFSWAVTFTTISWSLAAVLGFVFQCGLPNLEDFDGQCIDQRAFYTAIVGVGILIEICLIVQPILVVSRLRIARPRKLFIIACFYTRSLVVLSLIGFLILIWQPDSSDTVFLSYGLVICSTLADNFSVVGANMPYLRPFLQGLENGKMLEVGEITRPTHTEASHNRESNASSVRETPALDIPTIPTMTTQDSTEWKLGQIGDLPEAFLVIDGDETSRIILTSEFKVESQPITRK